MKKIVALALAVSLAGFSHAAVAAEGQGFVRAELGTTDVDFEVEDFADESDDDSAYAIRGGYYFHRNVGIEAFYTTLYDQAAYGAQVELSGYGIGAVAKKNFGADDTGFFVSARAGVAHTELKVSIPEAHGEASDTHAYAGVGLGYDFNDLYGVSLDYLVQKPDFDGFAADTRTLTLGFEVRF